MMMMTTTTTMNLVLLNLLALAPGLHALQNGFGATPVMGFNSYNDVVCGPNQTYVNNTIQALASKGLVGLGYRFFQIDCGWQASKRLANGSITYDTGPFPNGIRPLSQLAISKGMAWSMYTDEGYLACDTQNPDTRQGSLGYEMQDAAMFAAWNTQYVKVDNCYATQGQAVDHSARTDFVSRYTNMSRALQAYGIKGMLTCQWGTPYQPPSGGLQGPAQWTPQLATSFRVSDDMAQGWVNVLRIMNEAINVNLRGLSGPGNFADLDLLEVGNPGMTFAEQQSHFAIWSMFKSALMISTAVPAMSSATFGIFSNKDLIAINQDSLGSPVKLVQRFSNDYDLFAGPLSNGDRAVLILDQTNTQRTLSVSFADLNITQADVKNLWTGQTTKAATSFSTAVSPHGSAALRLSNIKTAIPVQQSLTYYEAEAGTLAGGAVTASCPSCSNGQKVGYVGSGGTLTFNNVRASSATMDVKFDYVNCDIGFLGGGGNTRDASITVNGGSQQNIVFPITGYDWSNDVLKSFRVRLSGFSTTGANTITIAGKSGGTQYAPDFDRIGVPA